MKMNSKKTKTMVMGKKESNQQFIFILTKHALSKYNNLATSDKDSPMMQDVTLK